MSKLSLIVPSYGGNPENLLRTVESCRSFCDDVVVVSTALHVRDINAQKQIANTVVELPWNSVFVHGFAHIHNAGIPACKNEWMLLLGVAETIAEQYRTIEEVTALSRWDQVFFLDHHNDPNKWGRIWSKPGNLKWSGIIHECIEGGQHSGVVARMADTTKTPCDTHLQNETLRWLKAVSYQVQYRRLLHDSGLLGATDRGWLQFVNGAKESIETFWNDHQDLIQPCLHGDLSKFLRAVDNRMDNGEQAKGVNFEVTGEPMTEGAI